MKGSQRRRSSHPVISKIISRKPIFRGDSEELHDVGDAPKNGEQKSSMKVVSGTDFRKKELESDSGSFSPQKLETIRTKRNRGRGNMAIPLSRITGNRFRSSEELI